MQNLLSEPNFISEDLEAHTNALDQIWWHFFLQTKQSEGGECF